MKSTIHFLVIMAFIIGSTAPIYSQNTEQIYQKGLMKEEGEGSLNEAIALYKQILENQDAAKSLQAKALLHIGMCYEKMGMQEATKAYQNLVKNYPGQKNEVALAKERLSRLIQNTSKEPEGIRIEQVWSGPEVDNSGSVSPNGEYLSFVDWDTGDLALRNLNTKQNKRLIAGSWDTPMQYAQNNVISPNGKQIAYSWYNDNASDLYLTDIDNPSPQLLYRKEGAEVYPVSWLSDKEIIVTIKKKGADGQIGSFSILDGTIEILETFEQRKWAQLTSSPDEKHIAFDFANETHNGNFDINILSMDDGKRTSLVTHSANNRVLGWIPGSNDFLFISDRSGTWDLWALTVDDGKPSGSAKPLYVDIGDVQSMGFTQSGDCYFGFSRRSFNTYLIPYNAEKKELLVRNGKSLLGSNLWVKWSSDAKYLCYIKEDRNSKNPWQLTIQNLKTGVERKVANNLLMAMSPCWSPDGNSILVVGIDKNESRTKGYKGGIYTVDVETGQTKEILLLANYKYNTPDDHAFPLSDLQWSKDGKSIYYLFFKDRLVKHNLETGEENILYTHSHFNTDVLSSSPDGKSLLFATRSIEEMKSYLFTMSAEGGAKTELCTSQQAKAFEKAIWSPDGKYIYFTERSDGTHLWRISVEGGSPQKVLTSKDRVEVFSIHPDGNQIALAIRERTTEIRVIKGLVQELKKLKVQDKEAEIIPKSITSIKVWSGPDADNMGTPSPNGKFHTYLDQATGNVGMREISSGKTSLLTKEGSWENPMQFTIGSIVSPDSKQLAYSWYNVNSNYEVRIIDINNSQPKILYGNKDEDVYPAAWSHDGKTIYARSYLNKTQECRILAINIANGDVQVLKTFNFSYWMYMYVSPDDQFIAFDVPNENNDKNFDIYTISADGKTETAVVKHPANDRLLGWFPDKNLVLFKSDRSETSDAWAVSILNGKAVKDPQRILINIGQISPMGFTDNGSYYYSIFSRLFTAYRAPLDISEPKLNLKSRKPLLGSIPYAMLSPNGKSLAYTKELKETAGAGWYHRPLFILDLESGKERKLLDWFQTRHPRWSPDGKMLLFIGYNKDRNAKKIYDGGIYSVEIESGKVRELLSFSKSQENEAKVSLSARSVAEWSIDQKAIYYTTNDQLIKLELESSQEEIILTNQEINRTLDLSRDGKKLLYSTYTQLFSKHVSGGEIKTLFTAGKDRNIRNAKWSPDGKYIFFAENWNNVKDGSVLWMISADGKTQKEVDRFKGLISSISIHPNGKEIVLSSFNQEVEIWRYDNLLSEENTKD